ncbi:MAG: PH domain-containing protein, partial [Mycobacteriaceae bacterium]|nr:PH domain-containing protein [Mycobacteriaceae bacterium]
RAILLAESWPAAELESPDATVLARWQPSWLRYGPLSLSGLVMIIAAAGVVYQSGLVAAVQHSRLGRESAEAAHRWGAVLAVVLTAVLIVLVSVLLSVVWSLLTYANLVLRRDTDVLHLRHGLLRVREHTYDLSRLRGGTLRQPLLVRMMGGARLDAVMTGVDGEGESSVLLPPCPLATAEDVLTELAGNRDVVHEPLHSHGRAAARRRWARALAIPVLGILVLALLQVPLWVWPLWAVLTVCCALLAADRARALGHRVGEGWLVARSGSLERRRDCIAGAGIIAWTVRQTLPQRRAGVATLIAATAAGRKHYHVLDVPAELAWSVAAAASPWVADSAWARR